MKKIIYLFVFALMTVCLHGQEKKLIWDYPVKPGMKEWADFTTRRQMVDACQIPQNILNTLSNNADADLLTEFSKIISGL
ncbi:MAG: hypothetical protein LBH32_02495 [Dysgonamonadaceae bacterium]|jgi:carbonic anhydrase|nr:hypothetical protein [Dysgonamonadaceae bacterium]